MEIRQKEQHERIQQSAIWGEARTSQPQVLGFAGQPSYFAHAPPLTTRSYEFRPRECARWPQSRGEGPIPTIRTATREAQAPPNSKVHILSITASSLLHRVFRDCRRPLPCFDSASPRWSDHGLIRPSAQEPFSAADGMESTYPGAYTDGSAATVSALQVPI